MTHWPELLANYFSATLLIHFTILVARTQYQVPLEDQDEQFVSSNSSAQLSYYLHIWRFHLLSKALTFTFSLCQPWLFFKLKSDKFGNILDLSWWLYDKEHIFRQNNSSGAWLGTQPPTQSHTTTGHHRYHCHQMDLFCAWSVAISFMTPVSFWLVLPTEKIGEQPLYGDGGRNQS